MNSDKIINYIEQIGIAKLIKLGAALITAILFVILLSSWNRQQHEQHALRAAQVYNQLLNSVQDNSKPEALQSLSDLLVSDYADTPYGLFGYWMQAKLAIDNKNLDKAEQALQLALINPDYQQFSGITRLRLAQVLSGNNKVQAAVDLLAKAVKTDNLPGEYNAAYLVLLGDLSIKQGNNIVAQQYYSQALNQAQDSSFLTQDFLRWKQQAAANNVSPNQEQTHKS